MTMIRMPLALAALALVLTACGEKPQTGHTRKSDTNPWDGSSSTAFSAGGWKVGDQASWDLQMRTRAQGQNEYARAAAQ